MPLNEALKLLCDHPKLLRRPIIISDSKIQVGFNEDDIRQFIPRPVRRLKFNALLSRLDGNTGITLLIKGWSSSKLYLRFLLIKERQARLTRYESNLSLFS